MKIIRMGSALCLGLGMLVTFLVPGFAAEKGTLVLGYEEWPPYVYHDENKQLVGLDIELPTIIAAKLGYTMTYKDMPSARLFKELEQGAISVAGSAFKRPEREEWAYFSEVYRIEPLLVFVKKGEAAKFPFKTLTELKGTGFRLGVIRSQIYGDEYAELLKDPEFVKQVQEVTTDEQNHLKLINGRIDGFISAYSIVAAMSQKSGVLDQVEPLLTIDTIPLRFLFSKAAVNEEFVSAFNAELANLKKDGTYQQIFAKYRLEPNMVLEP